MIGTRLEKVAVIKIATKPTKGPQLKPYFGLVNFDAKFLPSIATVQEPMQELLHRKTKWH